MQKKISEKILILFAVIMLSLAFVIPVHQAAAVCQQNATTICNPLSVNDIPSLMTSVIKILLDLLGVASVLMIVVAGFRMVMSAGSSEAVEKARTQLTWSVIGLAVAALAYSIIAIVSNLLANTK